MDGLVNGRNFQKYTNNIMANILTPEPVINLNGWVTIKHLAEEKECTTQYISKLIRNGKLPFRMYPELHGLRLVPSLGLQKIIALDK
jgi:hypothetical protein